MISLSLLPQLQTPLPAKPQPSRTCTLTPPSPMSQAATPSTSSWASGWRGQWQRSTGRHRARSSRCQQAPWRSPSPSSPSSPSSASASSCTAGDPTLGGSWAAPEGAKWPQHCSSSAFGCSTSSSPPWRPIATSRGFRRWRDGAARGGSPPPLPHRTPLLEARLHWRGQLSVRAATAQKAGKLQAKEGKTITE